MIKLTAIEFELPIWVVADHISSIEMVREKPEVGYSPFNGDGRVLSRISLQNGMTFWCFESVEEIFNLVSLENSKCILIHND